MVRWLHPFLTHNYVEIICHAPGAKAQHVGGVYKY